MVDPSALGYHGPEYGFVVEAGKIRELALAAGSRQRAYLGAEPIAMPILLKVAQFLWEPVAGSAVVRVGWELQTPPLHARQEFWFAGGAPSAEAHAAGWPATPSRSLAARWLGPITQTDIVRYQGASGDFNPVHHDPAAAARAGWPAVLVPGLYPAAVLSDLATHILGPERIRSLDFRFLAPSWLGDRLRCELCSTVRQADGVLRAELACARESDGAIITKAAATFAG